MALYAFDGTWNTEHDTGEYGRNTNVVRFRDLYQGPVKFYTKGVGTKHGWFGKLFGGAFGAGGKERITAACKHLAENFAAGDKVIDIIGFSRGAALALDFTNIIAAKGVRDPTTGARLEAAPAIRFLGLWDTVASFGIPFNLGPIQCQRINLGYRLTLPDAVGAASHALALDERRQSFRPTRVGRAHEVWFRGAHSDIGGGNGNSGRNAIALSWMVARAKSAGLSFDATRLQAVAAEINRDSPVRHELDPIKNRPRDVVPSDIIHASVVPYRKEYLALPTDVRVED